jgi:hypothetical protein
MRSIDHPSSFVQLQTCAFQFLYLDPKYEYHVPGPAAGVVLQAYTDYGPLFAMMKGARWWLVSVPVILSPAAPSIQTNAFIAADRMHVLVVITTRGHPYMAPSTATTMGSAAVSPVVSAVNVSLSSDAIPLTDQPGGAQYDSSHDGPSRPPYHVLNGTYCEVHHPNTSNTVALRTAAGLVGGVGRVVCRRSRERARLVCHDVPLVQGFALLRCGLAAAEATAAAR